MGLVDLIPPLNLHGACLSKSLSTGKIVANRTVDFEQVQWLNFTVRAQDHGTPPRFAELPVYLRIVDVNDNNPVFQRPLYQVNQCKPENQGTVQIECFSFLLNSGSILILMEKITGVKLMQ